jgi:hypothetical protein
MCASTALLEILRAIKAEEKAQKPIPYDSWREYRELTWNRNWSPAAELDFRPL